jgi:predicted RNase H-like nuclease (RuvC/YqgF family)
MNLKQKALTIAALLLAACLIAAAISSHLRMSRLESEAARAKITAEEHALRAGELEKRTYEYKQKIEYLEGRLADLQSAAREQDAELEKHSADTDAARRNVERFRRRKRPDANR